MLMTIVSLNVGRPRLVMRNDEPVSTGIFKEPVTGGIGFGRTEMIKRFLVSERSGFYLSVLKEGEVGVADEIELLEKNVSGVSVVDITRLYSSEKHNADLMQRAIATEALPESWRSYFRGRLDRQ
jgi:MOSC domain-containing protein YiiM